MSGESVGLSGGAVTACEKFLNMTASTSRGAVRTARDAGLPHDISLAGVNAFVAPLDGGTYADVDARRDSSARLQPSAPITVEIACGDRLSEIDAGWRDLVARADAPNVFMHPELLRRAGDADAGRRHIALLAWQSLGDAQRLVGLWAFAIRRAPQSIVLVPVLSAPPVPHAYLATPVVDRDHLDATLAAMLDRIAGDGRLPRIVALDAMGADGATMQALLRVLAARRSAPCFFGQAQRPKLASQLDGKQYLEQALSGSTRKKLRQQRRKLGEKGALESQCIAEPDAVCAAFEEFLRLEASGWKGRQGTALLNDATEAAFVRAMIAALAQRGEAMIYALTLDRRPVSMQIVLHTGPAAFTWKTAYDEALHDYSPGMLLFEDYTAAFLADKRIGHVDSCAFDDSGYMAAWNERQTIAHLWFDARRGGSIGFEVLARIHKGYLWLRAHTKALYLLHKRRRRR